MNQQLVSEPSALWKAMAGAGYVRAPAGPYWSTWHTIAALGNQFGTYKQFGRTINEPRTIKPVQR